MIKVSCLCPTYNRAPQFLNLLEEAVESFRRQIIPDYIKAELVILNDTPNQILVCDTPNVHVFNRSSRCSSLGEKRNTLVSMSGGDLLLCWDDDDISLPERIAQAVRYHEAGFDYFNPQRSWFIDQYGLHSDHKHGYCHNASAFTRAAWKKVGGYPESSAEDALLDTKLKSMYGATDPIEAESQWTYIYRWGVSSTHISGIAGGPPHDPHEPHYRSIGQQPVVPGVFHIKPRWYNDYVKLTRDHLNEKVSYGNPQ